MGCHLLLGRHIFLAGLAVVCIDNVCMVDSEETKGCFLLSQIWSVCDSFDSLKFHEMARNDEKQHHRTLQACNPQYHLSSSIDGALQFLLSHRALKFSLGLQRPRCSSSAFLLTYLPSCGIKHFQTYDVSKWRHGTTAE